MSIINIQTEADKQRLFKYFDENGYRMNSKKLYSEYDFIHPTCRLYIRSISKSEGAYGTMGNGFTKDSPRNWMTVPEFLASKGYRENSPAIKKVLKLNKLPETFSSDQLYILEKEGVEIQSYE